jgi:hypothetical protein
MMTHPEGQEAAEDATDQDGPTQKEGEGHGCLEGMSNENITGHTVGDRDDGIPEMTPPPADGEDLDELKGATKHQDTTYEGGNGCGRYNLVRQGKKAE